jgi:hypothetical protein
MISMREIPLFVFGIPLEHITLKGMSLENSTVTRYLCMNWENAEKKVNPKTIDSFFLP